MSLTWPTESDLNASVDALMREQNRPTEPGYCANCGRAPCCMMSAHRGCVHTTRPVTERVAACQIVAAANDLFPGLGFAGIVDLIDRGFELSSTGISYSARWCEPQQGGRS